MKSEIPTSLSSRRKHPYHLRRIAKKSEDPNIIVIGKNTFIERETYIEIQLRDGYIAKIDKIDLPLIKDYSWRLHRAKKVEARAIIKGKFIALGRFLLREFITRRTQIKYRNGDKLDNRRSNLRLFNFRKNSRDDSDSEEEIFDEPSDVEIIPFEILSDDFNSEIFDEFNQKFSMENQASFSDLSSPLESPLHFSLPVGTLFDEVESDCRDDPLPRSEEEIFNSWFV